MINQYQLNKVILPIQKRLVRLELQLLRIVADIKILKENSIDVQGKREKKEDLK